MTLNFWHLKIVVEWEPISLKKAVRNELVLGKVYAIKLVRKRRPTMTLKEAFDYVNSISEAGRVSAEAKKGNG